MIFLTFIKTVERGKKKKVVEIIDALPILFTQ